MKKLLRRKRIENSTKYIIMMQSEHDEFEVMTPTTVEEAKHCRVQLHN